MDKKQKAIHSELPRAAGILEGVMVGITDEKIKQGIYEAIRLIDSALEKLSED